MLPFFCLVCLLSVKGRGSKHFLMISAKQQSSMSFLAMVILFERNSRKRSEQAWKQKGRALLRDKMLSKWFGPTFLFCLADHALIDFFFDSVICLFFKKKIKCVYIKYKIESETSSIFRDFNLNICMLTFYLNHILKIFIASSVKVPPPYWCVKCQTFVPYGLLWAPQFPQILKFKGRIKKKTH